MHFDLSDEERALRDEARRFLEREAPVAHARAAMEQRPAAPSEVWRSMAGLGWMGLAIPEAYGGAGLGFVAQAILCEEIGRVVLPEPYTPTVAAAQAILLAGSDAQRTRWLPRLAAGEVVATLAEAAGAGGRARFALCGAEADVAVVAAPEGLFFAEHFSARPVDWMDATRPVAHLTLDGPGERLGDGASGTDRTAEALDRAAVALAAEMLGAAARVVELSVEYAKTRVQFGRPIGEFQAVKHLAAAMLLDVESARNAVWYAAWALDRGHPDAAIAASTAKAIAGEAAKRVTAGGIQIHGGTGFTWEHDLHLWFKRVRACDALFGDPARHRDRVAGILAARLA